MHIFWKVLPRETLKYYLKGGVPPTPHPTLHQTSLPTLPTCVIVNKNSIMPKKTSGVTRLRQLRPSHFSNHSICVTHFIGIKYFQICVTHTTHKFKFACFQTWISTFSQLISLHLCPTLTSWIYVGKMNIYTAAGGRNVIIAQITWAPGALIYDDISTASYSIPWVKAKCKQKIADELLQLFTSLALWQTLSCCSLHRVINNNNNGAQSASLKNKSNWTLRITNSEWTCRQKCSVHQFCMS